MSRPKPKTNHHGCVTGYGIWYECKPHTYSNAKSIYPQGHNYCVCIVDCTPLDRDKLRLGNGDSLLESDWEKCTSVVPKFHWERKKAERRICNRERASSKGSGRNDIKRGK